MNPYKPYYSRSTADRARRTREMARAKDCYIVRKGRQYLISIVHPGAASAQWSIYYYDAWQSKDRRSAEMVAQKVGGEAVRFDPILGVFIE